MDNQHIIEVTDLHKNYGTVRAVDGVSLYINKGEIFGVLGPNGAGKTTMIEILEGMRPPDSGRAFVCGIDVVESPQRVKDHIGVQLQSSSFFDNLKLTELLELFGSFYRRKVDVRALLKQVELEEKASSYYPKLSGGQKQRVSIAAALVNNPQVIFLDEPTTGLDPQARRHMWGLIRQLRSEDKTVVLTTHYMEEAEELCDRVAVMDAGKIIALDSPGALVEELLEKGFHKDRAERLANLEDVFLDLTGRTLRED